jgi:ubiquinone/menaquinone biosynthesis C-methylase UbiE
MNTASKPATAAAGIVLATQSAVPFSNPSSDVPYILGHSDAELRRLMLQAALLKPITRRLLLEAGLQPGMRVLDIGCGSGDVSLLVAEMVGPTGSVVGIDRSPAAVTLARDRARAAGQPGITFHEAAAENYAGPAPFDLAIGRYILMHQADPAVMIRAAASHVRMGGVVAFHEVGIFGTFEMRPSVPLWQQSLDLICKAFLSVLAHPDTAGRLIEHFHRAGLGQPAVFCETPVAGGADSVAYAWVAETLRSVMPQLRTIGVPTAGIGIDTLEDRIRQAVIAVHGQGTLPIQFCGWVQV